MTTSSHILAILATLAIGTTAVAQGPSAGSVGTSGSSGTVGTSGSTGSVGTSGSTGSVGTSGSTGSVGTSGTSGSGSIGTSGSTGTVGTSGSTGSVGTSGSTGTVGTSGSTGSVGTSGSSGPSGSVGTSGSSGTVGTSGSTGSVGTSGSTGSVGTSGTSGSGSIGTSGSTGSSGTSGSTGSVGTSGSTGSVGTSGSSGSSSSGGGGGMPTLPTVTSECFIIDGHGLSGVNSVTFGAVTLPMSAPFGEGHFTVVSNNQIEVCPPLCLDAGAYMITYSDANGVIGRLEVNLVDPTEPTLVCPQEHEVGTVQCNYIDTGGIEDVLIFTIISTQAIPTIIPGLVELEIGNQGTNYLCGPPLIGDCVKDTIGMIPLSAVGFTLHFQALFINPFTMVTPWPTTNACATVYVN